MRLAGLIIRKGQFAAQQRGCIKYRHELQQFVATENRDHYRLTGPELAQQRRVSGRRDAQTVYRQKFIATSQPSRLRRTPILNSCKDRAAFFVTNSHPQGRRRTVRCFGSAVLRAL